MPDDYTVRSASTGAELAPSHSPRCQGGRAARANPSISTISPIGFYSFGVAHPGADAAAQLPEASAMLVQDNGDRFDLGTVDILRIVSAGCLATTIPPAAHKAPVKSFEDWPAIRMGGRDSVLRQRPREVRSHVGLLADPLPEGFGSARRVPLFNPDGVAGG